MTTTTKRPNRKALVAVKHAEADAIRQRIRDEIAALRPIGIASEFSVAMGARPKKGVLVTMPNGATYVFAKSRVPSTEQVEAWRAEWRRADALTKEAAELNSFQVVGTGLTIGNRLPMLRGQELREAGLLTAAEERHLEALEAFWATIDEDDNRVIAVVTKDGSIERV